MAGIGVTEAKQRGSTLSWSIMTPISGMGDVGQAAQGMGTGTGHRGGAITGTNGRDWRYASQIKGGTGTSLTTVVVHDRHRRGWAVHSRADKRMVPVLSEQDAITDTMTGITGTQSSQSRQHQSADTREPAGTLLKHQRG
jgi:hypothetical protein